MSGLPDLLDRHILPDAVIRAGIRRLLRRRLRESARGGVAAQQEYQGALLRELAASPSANHTDDANNPHHQVPTPFFSHVLGKWMKYSAGYWPEEVRPLDEAEEAMLRLTCERVAGADGQCFLDLGCGWGSLRLCLPVTIPAPASPPCPLRPFSRHSSGEPRRNGGWPTSRPSAPTSTISPRRGGLTGSCRWRCSNISDTTNVSWGGSPAGSHRGAAFSCTSSPMSAGLPL